MSKKVSVVLTAMIFLIYAIPSVSAVSISKIDTGAPLINPIGDSNPLAHLDISVITGENVSISKINDLNFGASNVTDAVCVAITSCPITVHWNDIVGKPLILNGTNGVDGTNASVVSGDDYIIVNSGVITANITSFDNSYKLYVYNESVPVTVSGGVGSASTLSHADWVITRIYFGVPLAYAYNSEVYESATLNIIDRNRISHTGSWGIEKYHALNGSAVVNITNATDGNYVVEFTYVKSGSP
jgi:hypothetical protein